MHRSTLRVVCATLMTLVNLALIPESNAAASVPQPTIVQPPDRFFQEGSALDVVVSFSGANSGEGQRRANMTIQLMVDGALVEERALPSAGGVSSFTVAANPADPIGLIQVCVSKSGSGSGDRACRRLRAAGTREYDSLRRSLEELNEISDAVTRYCNLRLGYRGVPQTLAALVPDFLERVPTVSPLGTPYEYTATGEHFELRLALPGVGEIVSEDGRSQASRGAITDREAARLTRQHSRSWHSPSSPTGWTTTTSRRRSRRSLPSTGGLYPSWTRTDVRTSSRSRPTRTC